MTDERFDLICVDGGARTFPAVRDSLTFEGSWLQFTPAIGEPDTRQTITLPGHRVFEILHDRPMPEKDPRMTDREAVSDA
jgi:hypothetical protein